MDTLKSTKVDWKKIAVVGALVFLTAVTVGGLTWYVATSGAQDEMEAYKNDIVRLETEIKQLQADKTINEEESVTTQTKKLSVTKNGANVSFSIMYPSDLNLSDCQSLYSGVDAPATTANLAKNKINNACNLSPLPTDSIAINAVNDDDVFTPTEELITKKENIKINGYNAVRVFWKSENESDVSITTYIYQSGYKGASFELVGNDEALTSQYNNIVNSITFP